MSEQVYFSPTRVSVSKVRNIQAVAITGAQSERRGNEIILQWICLDYGVH